VKTAIKKQYILSVIAEMRQNRCSIAMVVIRRCYLKAAGSMGNAGLTRI
jgi:hypothetical protein